MSRRGRGSSTRPFKTRWSVRSRTTKYRGCRPSSRTSRWMTVFWPSACATTPADWSSPTKLMPATFSCDKVARSEAESFSAIVSDGRRILVGAFPIVERNQKAYLVILHDLSFIDARSGEAQGFVVAALAGVAIAIAGVASVFVVVMLRGWMKSLRRAVEEVRSGADFVTARARQIRDRRSDQEAAGRNRSRPRNHHVKTDRLVARHAAGAVAQDAAGCRGARHFQPRAIHPQSGERQDLLQTPASGLVSALEPVIRACGGTWIAHGSGNADRETVDRDDKIGVPPDAPSYTLRRIWISDEEQDGYYYGLANEGLWPLCHIAFVRPQFREADWQQYEAINERFADAVVQEAKTAGPDRSGPGLPFRARAPDDPGAPAAGHDHHVLAYPLAQRGDIQHLPLEGAHHRRAAGQHDPGISHPVPLQQFLRDGRPLRRKPHRSGARNGHVGRP